MSDIEKAEELLKKYLEVYRTDRVPDFDAVARFFYSVQEYFRKPVVVRDFMGKNVELSLDEQGDVYFDRGNPELASVDIWIPKDELVRGLKELGVIE